MSEKETGSTAAASSAAPTAGLVEVLAAVTVDVAVEEAPASGPYVRASNGDPAMSELLELFEGPLRDVVFPDVSRDTLRALAAETEEVMAERAVHAAALAEAEDVLALAEAAVARARAALRDAEAVVDDRQRALLSRGQRALSYAKVFAETDPDLHARLCSISLSRIAHRGRPPSIPGARAGRGETRALVEQRAGEPPRKRGRPRRVVEGADEPVDASVSS